MDDADEAGARRSELDFIEPGVTGRPRAYRPIAEHYALHALLGRGGMGSVYRARELTSGREVALKQLRYPDRAHDRAAHDAMFEREFRTLAELQHPRVIRVYDYGLDAEGPYYTMELLEGANLSECAPLPWREVCALIHDVCSSLALLHSRRLIHRDVTPANVRRTTDGRAKLIDFGGMGVMGAGLPIIGTAGFTAPEVLDRLTLDARTDLFSLGALLYFLLTGRPAYLARSFQDLRAAWLLRPPPPSSVVRELPEQLDGLVLRMLSLDPASRPRTAWEVMQPLAALAGLAADEDIDASRVYLATPTLVGREPLLASVRRRVRRAQRRHGRAIVFEGEPGSGRTRLLDAAAWEAQTQGDLIVRASGRGAGRAPFALLSQVTNQLIEAAPELFRPGALPAAYAAFFEVDGPQLRLRPIAFDAPAGRAALQQSWAQLWLQSADRRPIALAIDDLDQVDAASGGWLATLANGLSRHRLLLLCSAQRQPGGVDAVTEVIAHHSRRYPIAPLTAAEVETLISSIFGEVPHVSLLADRIFRVAGGNPGATMELARTLAERKVLRYDAGIWVLPAELDLRELPSSMDQALAAKVAALSLASRRLAGCCALSRYGALTQAELALIFAEHAGELAQAQSELLASSMLVLERADTALEVANEALRRALIQALGTAEARTLHRWLAELGAVSGKPVVATAYHFFAGELFERGLDKLVQLLGQDTDRNQLVMTERMPLPEMARLFTRAIDKSVELERPPREVAELRRWLCTISAVDDTVSFLEVSPAWLASLRRDSGLECWHELSELADPGARLMQALQRAGQRYTQLPEAERVYRVDEAIRHLVGYSVSAIAFGTRNSDPRLARGLAEQIMPFAPLSPLVDAMVKNCQAACDVALDGRYLQARDRWREVYERLPSVQGEGLRYAEMIRSAIAFAIGCLEAALGIGSAENWAQVMEAAPMTFIDALYLRRVVKLAAGDFEAAERYARQAELRAVQTGARPVFSALHSLEVSVFTLAKDISALRPVVDKLRVLASRHPGFRVHLECGEGCLELLRGDYTAAEQALARALSLCSPDPADPSRSLSPLALVAGMYANTLLALERYADARAFAEQTLQLLASREIHTADILERALALAQAQLGDSAAAAARLDALIERQRALGVTGLMLGVSYEARALVAISARDREALRLYAPLTAECYRQAPGSPVRGRYLQLAAEVRRAGLEVELALTAAGSATEQVLGATTRRELVASRLRDASSAQQRAAAALQLLCESARAQGGHMYLILPDGELAHAASHRAGPPSDADLDTAKACLQRAQSEASLMTEIMADSVGQSERAPLAWTFAQDGTRQHAMLMTGTRGQVARHIAVLLLIQPSAEGAARVRSLLFAVGDQLLLTGDGDAFGVTASD